MSDHEYRNPGKGSGASGNGERSRGPAMPAIAPGKSTLVSQVQKRSGSVSVEGASANQGTPAELGSSVHAAAEQGISGNSGPLPFAESIQPLFGGHDIGDIRAHTDASAAAGARAMGAEAFATGNHVAFGGAPDLHTAAHEAAHVVQQRAGVHLKGGVGEAGDAYERNADAVADRVVQGRSAHDLLPAPATSGAAAVQRSTGAVQRQATTMTDAQVQAALAWVTSSQIGVEAIREVQRVCGISQSGTYDEATARAVFAKQQELRITADGMAGQTFCRRTGIIFSRQAAAATVSDAVLQTVMQRFPNGVTVAVYPNYNTGVSGRSEFKLQADTFAANQQAVGVSGSAAVLGQACVITEVGNVIEVVQSIHRGLVDKWQASLQASAAAGEGSMTPSEPPAYTKVKNLALFSHGESWGVGLNASNDFSGGGLHNDTRGMNPANVESFVRGLHDAVVPSVRVELFACSTGHDTSRSDYQEWTGHAQGDRAGGDSFASSMAQALGPEATVSAHTTVGHTTENYAARVFGAEAGGNDTNGITLFDAMYPESFVQSELSRLFANLDDTGRAARHDSLREQMWAHFKDSITGEHSRPRAQKRYPVPMGQETFTNPEHARELLHADWQTNWISNPTYLSRVTPATGTR
jgi:hypothetical protein